MAFPAADGYANLPNGKWSPVLYSKKVQLKFRKEAVAMAITNTDYYGEISAFGDTVNVIKEPTITVAPYERGTTLSTQALTDDDFTLVIDQANYFQFKINDIERKQSHINWEELSTNEGAYRLRDAFDRAILAYMSTTAISGHRIAIGTAPAVVKLTGGDFTPLGLMNRAKRLLDQANVPNESRFMVADPVFYEMLGDEDSKLVNANEIGDSQSVLRNGRVHDGLVRGFTMYNSNNLPVGGAGPTGSAAADAHGFVIFGHKSATATAENLMLTEKLRDQADFGDIVRALHVFGRQTIRDNALVTAAYAQNA